MAEITFYLADQNPHRDRTLGITHITETLLEGLRQQGRHKLRVITSRSSFSPRATVEGARALPWRTDNAVARVLTDNLHPLLLGRDETDLWHYPKGFLSVCARPNKPTVGTVCDTILQHYADYYPAFRSHADYAYWLKLLRASLVRFDRVLTISHFSAAQIRSFCERHGVPCPPVRVTYPSVEVGEVPAPEEGEAAGYALHFASGNPHKCTRRLLELWGTLSQSREAATLPPLWIVGQLKGEALEACSRIADLRLLPRLPRAELVRVLRSAGVLLLPSEIEGFGLPAIEAFLLGTPVCYVSDTTVEEVLGDNVPGGFVLGEADSLSAAVAAALSIEPTRIAELAAGYRQKYSLAAYAESVSRVYDEVLA